MKQLRAAPKPSWIQRLASGRGPETVREVRNDERREADPLDTSRKLGNRRRQCQREQHLAPGLNIVPRRALRGPAPAKNDRRHLAASEVRARSPTVPERMPHEVQAACVPLRSAQDLERAAQRAAQNGR